jgi:hypothetical protein
MSREEEVLHYPTAVVPAWPDNQLFWNVTYFSITNDLHVCLSTQVSLVLLGCQSEMGQLARWQKFNPRLN